MADFADDALAVEELPYSVTMPSCRPNPNSHKHELLMRCETM